MLVRGAGTERMQPVRITTPGSNAVLPLKMVAAGTGATTTLTLYLVGEGRYAPVNFPSFTIAPESVVWDYSVSDSNFTLLRAQAYQASNGYAWHVESAFAYSPDFFRQQILNVIWSLGPQQAGYGAPETPIEEAEALANEDLDVLFAGMDPTRVMLTRTRAELSRAALGSDLIIGASKDQSEVSKVVETTRWVGVQPPCPPAPECDNPSVTDPGATLDDDVRVGRGCSVGETSPTRAAMGVGALVGLLFLARRSRRRAA
jgi:MYXO-CTERM domain-containing protein